MMQEVTYKPATTIEVTKFVNKELNLPEISAVVSNAHPDIVWFAKKPTSWLRSKRRVMPSFLGWLYVKPDESWEFKVNGTTNWERASELAEGVQDRFKVNVNVELAWPAETKLWPPGNFHHW